MFRLSGLAKTILQGVVKGEEDETDRKRGGKTTSGNGHNLARRSKGRRRRDRQEKRWEDNIREWTGLEFAKSQRAVENREKWRKLVAKSSVVPQRPSRLRDR